MKVVEEREDGSAVVELEPKELAIIGLIGAEFTQGPFAPSDEEWDSAVPIASRDAAIELFDSLP